MRRAASAGSIMPSRISQKYRAIAANHGIETNTLGQILRDLGEKLGKPYAPKKAFNILLKSFKQQGMSENMARRSAEQEVKRNFHLKK